MGHPDNSIPHALSTMKNRRNLHRKAAFLLLTTAISWCNFDGRLPAQDALAAKPYGDEVVAKADKIFADAGLRRSGKSITTTATAEVARGISGLARTRRSLKLVQDAWKQTSNHLAEMKRKVENLNAQNMDVNLQLAQGLLPSAKHNQLVALNNANVAAIRQIATDEERVKEKLAFDRKSLSDAEADYAETVIALRRDLNAIKLKLDQTLASENIKVALKVSNANFGTPIALSTDALIASTDKRLVQIEQEIFNESIPMEVTSGGSLYVNVTVGDKTTRMVVDSGASVICLPATTAAELGVTVPADAPQIRLVLADGREIPGRSVILAKVRIGQFEAEKVDAAVLDSIATSAEPLLGMSFLGNFKFEIDTADKSLKLLRVSSE